MPEIEDGPVLSKTMINGATYFLVQQTGAPWVVYLTSDPTRRKPFGACFLGPEALREMADWLKEQADELEALKEDF